MTPGLVSIIIYDNAAPISINITALHFIKDRGERERQLAGGFC